MQASKRDNEEAERALGITRERRSEPVVVRQYAPEPDAQEAALRTLLQKKRVACPATPSDAKESTDELHAAGDRIPQT